MTYHHDTYDRRIQLGASRRRYEDAIALHTSERWNGAIYLGGYAIECSLKSLICYSERKNNLKETGFIEGKQGAALHNLPDLLEGAQLMSLLKGSGLKNKLFLDRTGKLQNAYKTIIQLWQKDHLRYGDKVGNQEDSERFIAAVTVLHRFILGRQGEAS